MSATLALAGSGVFVACVGLLHVVRSDISPFERGISRYADGKTRSVITFAFLSLAVALLATSRLSPATPWWFGAALGMIGAAFTPVGLGPASRTIAAMHVVTACVFYLCVTVALFKALPNSHMPRVLLATLVIFVVSAAIPSLRRVVGLAQRLFLLLVVAGIVTIVVSRP